MEFNIGEFVTLREASDMFGKSQSMLRKVHYAGEVESIKRNNKLFIKVKDLEALYGPAMVVPRARAAAPVIIDPRRPDLHDVITPTPQSTEQVYSPQPALEEKQEELVDSLNNQITHLKDQISKLETVQVEKDRYYQNQLEESKLERQGYMNELSSQIKLFNEKWEREQILYLKQTEANQRLMEANREKDIQISRLLQAMNEEKTHRNKSVFSGISEWLSKNF